MIRKRSSSLAIFTTAAGIAYFAIGVQPASGYIDPGTGGSMLSSLAVIAGIAAAAVALFFTQLRHWGGWLAARLLFWRRNRSHVPEPSDEQTR